MKIVAINYKDDNILSGIAKDNTGINPFEVLENNNNHESDVSDNENQEKMAGHTVRHGNYNAHGSRGGQCRRRIIQRR